MKWKEHHWLFQKTFIFFFKPRFYLGCREEVALAIIRDEYLKKDSTDAHKEDTVQMYRLRARQEEIRKLDEETSKWDVVNIFCISKVPSMCWWKEATPDASHSVWPRASVCVNIPVFKPSQITSSPTHDCKVLAGDAGCEHLSEVTVFERRPTLTQNRLWIEAKWNFALG